MPGRAPERRGPRGRSLYATYEAAPDARGWTYLGDEMPDSAPGLP